MRLESLETPFLALDRRRLAANGARMRERARALAVSLRPHVKTVKSVEALRHALPEVSAITVSTLAEAEHFAAAGYRDILYGVGLAPAKVGRVQALRARGVELLVTLDNPTAVAALATAGGGAALIEVDSGAGRGGLRPDAPDLVALGRALSRPGLSLAGVMTHAGQSYGCRSAAELRQVARQERDAVVEAAGRLAAAGLACPIVSVGSTPTALFADDLAGVTEMRPGGFLLMDLYQAGLGCCSQADLAASVVASVIGGRPEEGLQLIDAGALALSQDRSTGAQARDAGYGLVGPLAGAPWPGVRVELVNQEHGFVRFDEAAQAAALPVGTRLRVWPNHACMTAAAYDSYAVTDGGEAVLARWPRVQGW